jgi:hypothetical protein
MRYLFAFLLLAKALLGQVTVNVVNPVAGETIYFQYAANGSASTSARGATITKVEAFLTPSGGMEENCELGSGGTYAGFCTSILGWQTQIYAQNPAGSLPVGTYSIRWKGTDSLGNTGFSSSVSITVAHLSPNCSHTNIGGSFYCEEFHSGAYASGTTGTVTGTTTGYTAGERIFVSFSGLVPVLSEGTLNSNITSGQLSFDVFTKSCGVPCSWPASGYAQIADINGAVEKIHYTAISGSSPGTQTMTVDHRGVSGSDCIAAGNPPNATANMPLVNAGSAITCGSAVSHLAGAIVNHWADNFGPTNPCSNTFGYTWTLLGNTVSGTSGDFNIVGSGFCTAVVPADHAGTDTITINIPLITAPQTMFILESVWSGLGTMGASSGAAGFGGPNAGSPAQDLSGPFATTPGNLNIGFVGGAPTNPGSGWNLNGYDVGRPFIAFESQIATGTTSQVVMNQNTEGYGAFGMTFAPAGVLSQQLAPARLPGRKK